jgi:putative membrane protein
MFQHPDPRWVDHGWWWPWFGGVLPLLLFVILIGFAVWAVIRFSSHPRAVPSAGPVPPSPPARDPVLEEVRLQYARGQISREEFVQRSIDLGGSIPQPPPAPPAHAPSVEPPPAEPPPAGGG